MQDQKIEKDELEPEKPRKKPRVPTFAEVYSEQDSSLSSVREFRGSESDGPFYGGEPRHYIDFDFGVNHQRRTRFRPGFSGGTPERTMRDPPQPFLVLEKKAPETCERRIHRFFSSTSRILSEIKVEGNEEADRLLRELEGVLKEYSDKIKEII
nr:hypothetical protein [Sicyoidochytrium minutum DNA virus]